MSFRNEINNSKMQIDDGVDEYTADVPYHLLRANQDTNSSL